MMKRCLMGVLFSLSMTASAVVAGDYLLYTPQKTDRQIAPANPADGVLVQPIVVRQGDTLKKIAKRYIGRGSYFPQILLFNQITNPDLIHTGRSILVPVSEKERTAHRSTVKKRAGKRRGKIVRNKEVGARTTISAAPPVFAGESAAPGDRMLFEKGFAAYRKGDYRKAIERFDLLTSRYPQSIFAPDAALYRAESYLKLSNQNP